MTFTTTRDIPDAPNDPSEDQPPMKINTNSMIDIWDVDHIGFNKARGGQHKFVRLQQQTVNPAIVNTQGAIFEKIVNGNTELFYKYGSAPQNSFQITNNGSVSAVNGYSSLIGIEGIPLWIQWGSRTVDQNGATIRDDSPFLFTQPFRTACFSVVLTGEKASTGPEGLWVKTGSLSTTGFSIKTSANAGQFTTLYFYAIGN